MATAADEMKKCYLIVLYAYLLSQCMVQVFALQLLLLWICRTLLPLLQEPYDYMSVTPPSITTVK